MDIKKEIESLHKELIQLRRDFHKYPELGYQEFRTSEIIANYLKSLGLEVTTEVTKTGVIGVLRGSNPGLTVLLRSDMDALPVQEETDLEFKSIYDGKMHACGHDGHMAMLLIAAKILAKHRETIKGNVKFVFQPNEEDAGAEDMINEGILENPRVDAALCIHLWSPIETGKIGIVPGPIMASSYYFKLVINGKGGHGGAPHLSNNPINCAMNIIQSTENMLANRIDALKPTVITFCKIHCGSSPIIIPEKIELEGSIRCLHEQSAEVHEEFEKNIKRICDVYGTTYNLDLKCGNKLLNNDSEMTELVKKVGASIVGSENIQTTNVSVMVGDDFAEFALRVPSAYYFLGVASKEKETDYAHHHPHFNIDEDVLSIGVELHVRGVLEYLNNWYSCLEEGSCP